MALSDPPALPAPPGATVTLNAPGVETICHGSEYFHLSGTDKWDAANKLRFMASLIANGEPGAGTFEIVVLRCRRP